MTKISRPRSVDLNLFKVFATVYRLKNLTHAGEHLAMTQPAVSRALDRLHHLFNERLFYRTGGEMRPTRTAEILAPSIIEALSLLDTAVAMSEEFSPQNLDITFKLGGNDYVSAVVLPGIMALLTERAPSVLLTTTPCTYIDAGRLIERNIIDCAITSSLPAGSRLGAVPLFREDYVAVSARHHPFVGDKLTLGAYLECEHILVSYTGTKDGWVDEHLAAMNLQRKVIAAVHMFLAVPHIIIDKPYLCTLPRRLAMQFADAYPLAIHELPFESQSHLFHLVWPLNRSRNPAFCWLKELVTDACLALNQDAPHAAMLGTPSCAGSAPSTCPRA